MFLAGELMGYGLQSEDFEQYRNSEYCYATPSETIFFFIFNGYKSAIDKREEDLDTTKFDLQTMTLESFRKAVAVTYDKEALCTAVSPSRSGGYGLIGNSYIYDPETGARYRDTDQAKKALCEFYSVDISKFDSLDDAVASITGYDPVAAKELYTQAFNEALAAGYITDTDNDGKSDQTVQITYASSASSAFITKTLDYLNQKLLEVLVGTPFEGKIQFVESAPLGNEWSNQIKAGLADTVLGGWSGSALDPFGLTDLYTNPSYQYDAKWFDASSVKLAIDVNTAKIGEPANVETIEMNLRQWSDALNGATVKVGEREFCFGDGIADVETRLDILAKIESTVLMTYDYIPMLQDASMALLSKQVFYVVEEYNPIMGRGGIRYMKYNYDDAAWAAYVQSQGGELAY
jgi:ABC-type oligopeptide transport system substrate-binding subunit